MEESIYNKLPCGGGLWNYKYQNKDDFIQKPYDNSEREKIIYNIQQKPQNKDSKKRKQPLMNYIIHKIDSLASLYTYNMFDQAEQIFKEKMTDFVSKYDKFGPKKKRILLSWITKNNYSVNIDEVGKYVAEFLSWFLDSSFKYIPENTNIIEHRGNSAETGTDTGESDENKEIYITSERKTFVIR